MLLKRAPQFASRLATVGLSAGMIVGAVSCKPTAFISPLTLNFQAVHSTGAVGNECSETSADTRPELSFTLVDTNQEQMFPGHRLGKFELTLTGSPPTLSPENLVIDGTTGTLYPAPDVLCGDGNPTDSACPDEELAANGFTCQPLDNVEFVSTEACSTADDCTVAGHVCTGGTCQPRVDRVCALADFSLEISPNASVSFDGTAGADRSIILLMSNGASVLGTRPNGNPEGAACSTDPFDKRTRAASLMLGILGNPTNDFSSNTDLCLGAFAGASEPDYRFETSPNDCLRSVREDSSDAQFLSTQINDIARSETPAGRNPWGAIIDAAGRFDEWNAAGERHIVLVTDGGTSEDVLETTIALQQTFERAMDTAVQNDVRVHIIQWNRPEREVDCRVAQTETAIEEYARVACATNGSFTFVQRPDDIEDFLKNLGRAIPGRYSVPVVADGLATLPLGAYKASFTLSATVDGERSSFEFAARAGSGSTGRQDTRMTMVNRGDCMNRPCLPGYVCDDTSATCHTPAPGATTEEEPPVEEEGPGE